MRSWLIIVASLALVLALWRWQARRQRQWRANLERQHDEQGRREQQQLHAQFQVRQQALFNGMIEGVLLLDEQGRVQMINESLRKFFGVATDIRGQTIMEAFRWHELAALAARLPEEKNISGAELEIHRITRRFLQVNASIVHGHAGDRAGAIVRFPRCHPPEKVGEYPPGICRQCQPRIAHPAFPHQGLRPDPARRGQG